MNQTLPCSTLPIPTQPTQLLHNPFHLVPHDPQNPTQPLPTPLNPTLLHPVQAPHPTLSAIYWPGLPNTTINYVNGIKA